MKILEKIFYGDNYESDLNEKYYKRKKKSQSRIKK